MAQTIEEQERDQEHAAALAELKRQRNEAATRLAKIDEKIGQLDAGDFRSRLGSTPLRSMTLRERSETAARLGYGGFRDLVLGRR